jgi:two-component system response regulator FlrC
VIQRGLVLSDHDLDAEHILLDARALWQDTVVDESDDVSIADDKVMMPVVMQDLKEQEIKLILTTLKLQAGNRARTAEVLQMSPRTLRYKLARLRDAGYDVE